MHPTSRSLRAHQSRRDHRALFRPETGSRSFAGSWDPRLGPLLSNDRGHLPEARMLLRETKFREKSFATSATCHGGAPRTDTTCLRSALPHVRAVDAVCTHATLQPQAHNNVGFSIKVCKFCEALWALPHSQAAATTSLLCAKRTMLQYVVEEVEE